MRGSNATPLPLVVGLLAGSLLAHAHALGSTHFGSVDLGDRLIRDYGEYTAVPSTAQDAIAAGWAAQAKGRCDPKLGVLFAQSAAGPSAGSPLLLYFTPGGQAAGVGVEVYGEPKESLVKLGYFLKTGSQQYRISVSFRNTSVVCSPSTLPRFLGDQLVVNQGGVARALPLTADAAVKDLWQKGSCFSTMGHHYFRDLSGAAPDMSWVGGNLLPVVPMYNVNGTINAFFFASTDVQQGITGPHQWEPVPLVDALMCKNFCNKACTFSDTMAWSTLHIYMNDPTLVKCPGGCSIGCCP